MPGRGFPIREKRYTWAKLALVFSSPFYRQKASVARKKNRGRGRFWVVFDFNFGFPGRIAPGISVFMGLFCHFLADPAAAEGVFYVNKSKHFGPFSCSFRPFFQPLPLVCIQGLNYAKICVKLADGLYLLIL